MNSFPDQVIVGDGVVLRPLADADLPAIAAACNDPQIQRWLPLPSPYGLADASTFVHELASATLATGRGIERAVEVEGSFAGAIGLHATDWAVGSTEAGYWLAPWARGRGVMTRALVALTGWVFEQGFGRVQVLVATGNDASLATACAAGFIREGTLRRAGRTRTGPEDMVVLSRLPSDPRPDPRSPQA